MRRFGVQNLWNSMCGPKLPEVDSDSFQGSGNENTAKDVTKTGDESKEYYVQCLFCIDEHKHQLVSTLKSSQILRCHDVHNLLQSVKHIIDKYFFH